LKRGEHGIVLNMSFQSMLAPLLKHGTSMRKTRIVPTKSSMEPISVDVVASQRSSGLFGLT
jgi:hypothetical protein